MSVEASDPTDGGGRLQLPHEVMIPEDCAGWEAMYPYDAVFGADRRAADAARFWFHDGMHFPEPLYPFDEVVAGCLFVGLGQANARVFGTFGAGPAGNTYAFDVACARMRARDD